MASGRQSKSSLFLMEIVLAILFFSLASAICMQLFAKAHIISTNGSDVSTAVSYARSTAECFKETDGDLDEIKRLLGGEKEQDTLIISYDKDWNISQEENTPYRMTVNVTKNEEIAEANIVVEVVPSTGEPLYVLDVKKAI